MAPDEIQNDPIALWEIVQNLAHEQDRPKLLAVHELAVRAHAGQYRMPRTSGFSPPYIVHPLRVARIAGEEWGRTEFWMLATCMLHDVLQDTSQQMEAELLAVSGKKVFDAVWKLTKPRLPLLPDADARARREARYFSVLRAAPKWVRLVKCADRLDNVRDAPATGNVDFWTRYSSETIGWHLYLAHETSAVAEAALFRAIVEGERELRGVAPVWADGRLVDPVAASLVPEKFARRYGAVGLAVRGDTLVVGMRFPDDMNAIEDLCRSTGLRIEPIRVSDEALADALAAGLHGPYDARFADARGHHTWPVGEPVRAPR